MDYSQIHLNLLTTDGILHKETSYFLNSFLAYKNAIRRKSKILHFSKGVKLWFSSKFSNFLSVCFSLQ